MLKDSYLRTSTYHVVKRLREKTNKLLLKAIFERLMLLLTKSESESESESENGLQFTSEPCTYKP